VRPSRSQWDEPGVALPEPAAAGEELQRTLQEETVVVRRFSESGIELVVRRRS